MHSKSSLFPLAIRSSSPPAIYLLLISVLSLAFIWAIPNGQLPFHRNFPLYLGFGAALYQTICQPQILMGLWTSPFKKCCLLLALLSLWMLIIGFWSPAPLGEFLRTYNGTWLRVLQTGFMGFVFIPLILQYNPRLSAAHLFLGLLLAMWLAILIQLVDVSRLWWQTQQIPWLYSRIAYSKMEISTMIGLVFSLLCAEIGARIALGRRWLPLPNLLLAAMLTVCMISQILLLTRNAMLGMISTVLSVTLMAYLARRNKIKPLYSALIITVGLALAATLAVISWKSDSRWQAFVQTVPLALDTEHHRAWLNFQLYPYPQRPDGQTIDGSAYERIAWLKIGLQLIGREPLGQGLDNDVFHFLVDKHFGPTTTTQSHSGLINFTLNHGLPGLILWLLLLGQLFLLGVRAFYQEGKIPGLYLMLLILALFFRGIINNTWQRHHLEESFFLCAFFVAACLRFRTQPLSALPRKT